MDEIRRYTVVPTNLKRVFWIVEYTLFGLKCNGHHKFYYRVGLYKQQSKEIYSTSLTIGTGLDRKCYEDFDGEVTTPQPSVLPILEMFNQSDLTGFPDCPIYNLIYFLHEKKESYIKCMEEIGYPLERIKQDIPTVEKFSNYYLTLYFIELFEEYRKPYVAEFLKAIKELFDYEPDYTASPSVMGAISSMLNLEHNAIPFKYIKNKSKANLDVYLALFKRDPNSSYNYKIKNRRENPEF